jgi:hypothetical protein
MLSDIIWNSVIFKVTAKVKTLGWCLKKGRQTPQCYSPVASQFHWLPAEIDCSHFRNTTLVALLEPWPLQALELFSQLEITFPQYLYCKNGIGLSALLSYVLRFLFSLWHLDEWPPHSVLSVHYLIQSRHFTPNIELTHQQKMSWRRLGMVSYTCLDAQHLPLVWHIVWG